MMKHKLKKKLFGGSAPAPAPAPASASAPMKNVFAAGESGASATGSHISGLSMDDFSVGGSSLSFADAKSEWAGESSSADVDHSGRSGDDTTMSDIDQVSSTRMYSINEGDAVGRMEGGSIASASVEGRGAHGVRSSTSASDQLEQRIRAKQDDTNDEATSRSSPTANDQFENRLRSKLEEGNTVAKSGTKPAEASDGHEGRLKAKLENAKVDGTSSHLRSHSSVSSGSVGTSSANEQFENRLKAKMEAGDSTTNDCYKNRLRAKIDGNTAKSPSMESATTASGRFEDRLRTKMKQGSKSDSSSPPSTASEGFENRLKAKINNDTARSLSSPSAGENAATASSRFEDRLRHKLSEGSSNDNAPAAANTSPTCGTTESPGASSSAARYDDGPSAKLNKAECHQSPGAFATNQEDRLRRKIMRENDAGATFIVKCADEGKYNDIIQYIGDKPAPSSGLVSLALEKIPDALASEYGYGIYAPAPKGKGTNLNDNWISVLSTAMMNHITNEDVQSAALQAIWAIVALDTQHASQLTTNKGLEALTIAMETHPREAQIQLCGSGLIACLASSPEHASCLMQFHDGRIVERMGPALRANCSSVLKALCKMLVASRTMKTPSDHLLQTIGRFGDSNCSSSECLRGAMVLNAIYAVLGVMIDSPSAPGVQIWGCNLLGALFEDDSISDSSATTLSALVDEVGRHLDSTTELANASQAMHEAAICLLSHISSTTGDLLAGKEAFSSIAVRAMLACPKSRAVAMLGCQIISIALCVQEETADAILGTLQDFDGDEEAAGIAINTISLLTKEGYQTITALLLSERLIPSIVSCMSRYRSSQSIQVAASDILSAVSLDNHVIGEICSLGGASRLVSSLFNCSHEPMVVHKAFLALANLIGICDAAILKECRAVKGIVTAMEANPTDICVQIHGATTLWNLGSCHAKLKQEIVHCDGIPILAKAMRSFLASEQMQEKGILALWVLTSSVSLAPNVTSSAIEAIADGTAAHLTSTKICEHAMGALSTLASSRAVVNDLDAVLDLITSCMVMHLNSPTVQQGALAALTKITHDREANQVMQITPEVIEVVVDAMRAHVYVQGVMENSIILLRQFTFGRENIIVMSQSPFLSELIKAALSTHTQGSIRLNAENLLQILPSLPASQ